MKYQHKLILSIIGVSIFVFGAIVSVCLPNATLLNKVILGIICGLAAFIDAAVFMLPYIFSYQAIKFSNINPNRYVYNKKLFVDRKVIYKTIKNQIKTLDKSNENTIWIKLCGADGIGKKALVSKFFYTFTYPFNKFFFVNRSTSYNNILDCIKEKYPIDNESDELLYYNKMKALKRTFIVIPFDNAKMNTSIVAFMSNWMRKIKHKRKLVIISLDSKQSVKITNSTNTYLFEYEIKPLMVADSKKLISKIVHNLSMSDIDKIAKISEGNPENIKYLCDKFLRFPEGIQITERTDMELRMNSETKSLFFDLCILNIVNYNIPLEYIKNITILEELCLSKKIFIENNHIYVSEWLLNALLLSDKYKSNFNESMNKLKKSRLLNHDKYLLAKAIVFKNSDDLLLLLEKLDKKQDYKLIKYVYIKTYFTLENISETVKKQIAIIYIKALLQLGEYDLVAEAFAKIKTQLLNNINNDDYEINFLLADYYHLTSDYDTSNAIFDSLFSFAKNDNDNFKLRFSLAHNHRHSGEINRAYEEFATLINDTTNDSEIHVRSVTAKISIDYFKYGYNESLLRELESITCNTNVKFNLYRHIISLKRRNNLKLDEAINLCLSKIDELKDLNLRIIYDYYFELAECYRSKFANGENYYFSESLTYYNKALIFAEMNLDSNLRLNSIIGKALLEYTKTNNNKKLYKQMEYIINDGKKISKLIYGSILTIIACLNDMSDCEYLKDAQFKYYYEVFKSRNLKSFYLTVM